MRAPRDEVDSKFANAMEQVGRMQSNTMRKYNTHETAKTGLLSELYTHYCHSKDDGYNGYSVQV